MNISTSLEIADLQKIAKRRVPKMFYDYADAGSWSQSTYLDNSAAFTTFKLRQRVAVDVKNRSLATLIAGQKATMPVALAPVGLTGMQHANGEIAAAKAAEKFGVPFALSTMSICSIEAVAAATQKPFWFQLYMMRDRGFVSSLIDRARAAKCSALVLTLDLQVLGQRHQDIRNGLSAPPKPNLRSLLDLVRRPNWCWEMLFTSNRTFGNIVGYAPGVENMTSLSDWISQQFDPTMTWEAVDWIRRQWDGKLILKGINDVEDAKIAAQTGADAIVVSNHGGRQLDGAVASINTLTEILHAVGDITEVYFDSGIRSGQDVFKAMAIGAHATLIGRAYIYGLGAGGERGVSRALEIIRQELDLTMAMCGETDISNVGIHNLD